MIILHAIKSFIVKHAPNILGFIVSEQSKPNTANRCGWFNKRIKYKNHNLIIKTTRKNSWARILRTTDDVEFRLKQMNQPPSDEKIFLCDALKEAFTQDKLIRFSAELL